jgi:hypothetical protein
MIRGALKRTWTVELAAYVVYAIGAVVIALLLPGITPLPDWAIFILMIGVQLWLYKRFYGRL